MGIHCSIGSPVFVQQQQQLERLMIHAEEITITVHNIVVVAIPYVWKYKQ